MDYEETQWRNGVFLVEHALFHRDKIIVSSSLYVFYGCVLRWTGKAFTGKEHAF